MRKANRRNGNGAIYRRIAEVQMSERDRERATHAIRDAEAIIDAVIRFKDWIASLGAMLLKPGLKH